MPKPFICANARQNTMQELFQNSNINYGIDVSQSIQHSDEELTSIDLFCGAGGITEGFRQAGFQCLYANDFNAWAIETFQYNHPNVTAQVGPIEYVNPREIRANLGIKPGDLHVLAGGPPCQGFSINAPSRFLEDPRNSLFREYMRFVDEFEPRTFLFENVPGLLSIAGGDIFHLIIREFENRGYSVTARILFAAHYGIPQERWRLIILGSKDGRPIEHPTPTHYAAGRSNFTGGNTMTYKLSNDKEYLLFPKVTVGDALSDLPHLLMGEGAEEASYLQEPISNYSKKLRNPNGILYNHVAAKLSSQNIERLKHIRPGGSWRDIPHDLLPKGMQRARKTDHTKRYGRLTDSGLSGTVMTKCDPHWGSVFLPNQDRSLTVREAARLQSFPDWYRFLGPRVAQYEQVGNAVPVLMVRKIADQIRAHMIKSAIL